MVHSQKTLEKKKVKIVVDHREANNGVFLNLGKTDAELEKQQLKTGDYICSDKVCVERKTLSDFIQSIIDKRLFNQLSAMKECFESPLLILEGNPELLFIERNVHPNMIRGTLASLAVDYKMPIIWTRNAKETADQIYWLAYREQVKGKNSPVIRCPKKSIKKSDLQEFLISGLPHVNSKLSKNLLKKFKTPKKIFSAKEDKLMKVDGIGKEKAKKIWQLLNEEYNDKK